MYVPLYRLRINTHVLNLTPCLALSRDNKYNLLQNIKGQKTTNTCPDFAIYVILMSDKCVNGSNYGIPSLTVIFMKPVVVCREASVTSSVNVYSPTSKFSTVRNGVFNPCE